MRRKLHNISEFLNSVISISWIETRYDYHKMRHWWESIESSSWKEIKEQGGKFEIQYKMNYYGEGSVHFIRNSNGKYYIHYKFPPKDIKAMHYVIYPRKFLVRFIINLRRV